MFKELSIGTRVDDKLSDSNLSVTEKTEKTQLQYMLEEIQDVSIIKFCSYMQKLISLFDSNNQSKQLKRYLQLAYLDASAIPDKPVNQEAGKELINTAPMPELTNQQAGRKLTNENINDILDIHKIYTIENEFFKFLINLSCSDLYSQEKLNELKKIVEGHFDFIKYVSAFAYLTWLSEEHLKRPTTALVKALDKHMLKKRTFKKLSKTEQQSYTALKNNLAELEDLFIKPIQQLPKLPSLLQNIEKEVIKRSPQCAEIIRDITDIINQVLIRYGSNKNRPVNEADSLSNIKEQFAKQLLSSRDLVKPKITRVTESINHTEATPKNWIDKQVKEIFIKQLINQQQELNALETNLLIREAAVAAQEKAQSARQLKLVEEEQGLKTKENEVADKLVQCEKVVQEQREKEKAQQQKAKELAKQETELKQQTANLGLERTQFEQEQGEKEKAQQQKAKELADQEEAQQKKLEELADQQAKFEDSLKTNNLLNGNAKVIFLANKEITEVEESSSVQHAEKALLVQIIQNGEAVQIDNFNLSNEELQKIIEQYNQYNPNEQLTIAEQPNAGQSNSLYLNVDAKTLFLRKLVFERLHQFAVIQQANQTLNEDMSTDNSPENLKNRILAKNDSLMQILLNMSTAVTEKEQALIKYKQEIYNYPKAWTQYGVIIGAFIGAIAGAIGGGLLLSLVTGIPTFGASLPVAITVGAVGGFIGGKAAGGAVGGFVGGFFEKSMRKICSDPDNGEVENYLGKTRQAVTAA